MRHSRGFGIQSPRDYSFIRYVVNEHYPYYAYADLAKTLPEMKKRTRKVCELYFRISNFCQAGKIVNCMPADTAYDAYFHAGCLKSVIVHSIEDVEKVELLRVSVDMVSDTFLSMLFSRVDERSLVIVEGIHRTGNTKRHWKNIIKSSQVTISFDLYYCGILFFDKKRYKQNYIINF